MSFCLLVSISNDMVSIFRYIYCHHLYQKPATTTGYETIEASSVFTHFGLPIFFFVELHVFYRSVLMSRLWNEYIFRS
jgi:hypothetical protein